MAKATTKRTTTKVRAAAAGSRSAKDVFHSPREGHRRSTLTDSMIKRAEKKLGVRLPRSYLDLLRQQNGGRLRLNGVWSKEQPPRFHTDRPIYTFDRIDGIREGESDSIIRNSEIAHSEWGVPELLVPFDGDGHWWLCLDYRECGPDGEPCITHFEPPELIDEEPTSCRVADSFADLLHELMFDSGEDDLFALDDDAVRGEALAGILRSLGAKQRRNVHHQWFWSKHRYMAFDGSERCLLAVHANGEPRDPDCPARPGGHPLLHVSVDETDREACLRELAEALGSGAECIHQPADRVQIDLAAYHRKPPMQVTARPTRRDGKPRLDATAINEAIWNNRIAVIREKLAAGLDPNRRYLGETRTVLELAACFGKTQIVKLLLKHVEGPIKADPLGMAAECGHVAVMKALVDAGVRPERAHIGRAIERGRIESVRFLIRNGAKPTMRDVRLAETLKTFDEQGRELVAQREAMVRAVRAGLAGK